MNTDPSPPRFVLFPQVSPAEDEPRRPTVRRYVLAQVYGSSPRPRVGRYDYLRRGHD